MTEKQSILAIIHLLNNQGKKDLGGQWPEFTELLRKNLSRSGVATPESSSDFLVFSFSHPVTAISSILEAIGSAKKKINYQKSAELPLQLVLHLQKKTDKTLFTAETSPGFWKSLQNESLYISRRLRIQWKKLLVGYEKIPFSLEDHSLEVSKLNIADESKVRQEKLSPEREIIASGQHNECFYCGMSTHAPASCPSKFLSYAVKAISDVGYLPFPRIKSLYKDVLPKERQIAKSITGGIDASDIRHNESLQLFVAYFDVYLMYQVRFLRYCAFSTSKGWDNSMYQGKINIDSHNLNMAIDCLRVGRLEQAATLFDKETKRAEGKDFFANVGLAFLALDTGRMEDMGVCLKKAARLAETDKEQIYVRLLQARFYTLQGDFVSAGNAVSGIFSLDRDCLDARYCKIQLTVRSEVGERALKPLAKLVDGAKEYFMAALFDPVFLHIRGQVEDLLVSELQAHKQKAQESLVLAQKEMRNLTAWLPAKDPSLRENRELLLNIEQQYVRGSYYDMIDVATKAMSLYYTCRRLKESLSSGVRKRVHNASTSWRKYRNFWQAFRFQSIFGTSFADEHDAVRKRLDEIETMVVGQKGDMYQDVINKVATVEEGIKGLQNTYRKMVWLKNSFDIVKTFCIKLILVELLVVITCLSAVPVFEALTKNKPNLGFVYMLRNPVYLEQIFWALVLMVAPIFALLLTFFSVTRKT